MKTNETDKTFGELLASTNLTYLSKYDEIEAVAQYERAQYIAGLFAAAGKSIKNVFAQVKQIPSILHFGHHAH